MPITDDDALGRRRFTIEWALPLEPGLPTHVVLYDHQGDHITWTATGGNEAEALATLIGRMSQAGASPEALDYVAAAYRRRLADEK
jgi:hypothetical protein